MKLSAEKSKTDSEEMKEIAAMEKADTLCV